MSASQPTDSRTFTHCLDAADRIVAVNEDWLTFAQENSAPHLTRPMVLERKLWNFVSGAETQGIYESILKRVRTAQKVISVPYRCDAPDRRRFMVMEVAPLPGLGVRMSSRVLRIEVRPAITWPEPPPGAQSKLIVACSWCKRIEVQPGEWKEIEEATSMLGMDTDTGARAISHGICESCAAGWMEQLGDMPRE